MFRRVLDAVIELVRDGEPWAYEEDEAADPLASCTDGWFGSVDATC